MMIGVVFLFYAPTASGGHLLDEIGTVEHEFEGVGKLFAIAVGIKEAGDAMFDEFAARTLVCSNDGTAPGIRFENRFSQGLVGVGWKYREGATGDQLLEFFAMDHAGK